MKLSDHLERRILHAQRMKHCVLGLMLLSAMLVAAGLETYALVLHWAANIVWIYET